MSFDLPKLAGLDAWIAANEAKVEGTREGCEKQIIWADGAKKTKTSVIYIHGFSASLGEVRPVPDLVAAALGANLFYTRLEGHGQDGIAMGQASVQDWHDGVAEALAIGAALGDEVIVIGCSTGCTLMTTALAKGAKIKAMVHLSPNYGMKPLLAKILLKMPRIEKWGHLVVGKTIGFEPRSPEHAQFWTLNYDTRAIYTMAASVREAHAQPIEAIKTPAYFAFCENDSVISAKTTRGVMQRWGGPVHTDVLIQGPDDDADGHVMAGDILSPKQSAPLADRITAWVKQL